MTDLVGTTLDGQYRVEAAIGGTHAGGTVYRGRDVARGAGVVIRCPAVPPGFDDFREFLAEAALLARVCEASADVERLLGSGVAEVSGVRVPYCAFEWITGRSLDEELAARPFGLPLGDAMALLDPAARALAAAHEIGATHGDVRPKNLWLVDAEGRGGLVVAAFTLASRVAPGEPLHAPAYGAPEHFTKAYGAIGPATDVYGLALTLVELVTGHRALEGDDPSELYLATSDLSKRPTLRACGASPSDAVESVLMRALAVDPKRRWQSAREMWDALLAASPDLVPLQRAVRTSEGRIASVPPGTIAGPAPSTPRVDDRARPSERVRVAPLPPRVGPKATPSPDRGHRRKRGRGWLVAASLAALALGGIVARVERPVSPASTRASASPPRPSEEPAVRVEPFSADMVRVPASTFVMGSDHEGKGEKPPHEVTLKSAFYIDRTEVPALAYAACIEDGACTPNNVHYGENYDSVYGCNTDKDRPRHPANCVDRGQAERYCAWAGKRLPTEAEWELAARGTDRRDYPWGDAAPTSCQTAILTGMNGPCGERTGTWEVGTTAEGKSPFGALDMAGNVWEWVADGYEEYPKGPVTDPKVAVTGRGVLRGGSWDYAVTSAKTTYRLPFPVENGNVSTGIRCARDAND